jgi:hypothetical protein
MVGAIHRPVLEGYEAACRAVGLHPGLVEISGLALLTAAFAARPAADRLLVNWDEGYVSLILARGEWPILVRTLTSEAASSADDIAREVGNTVLYYRERLAGPGLADVLVRSAAFPRPRPWTCSARPWSTSPRSWTPGSGSVPGIPARQHRPSRGPRPPCGGPRMRPLNFASQPFRNLALPALLFGIVSVLLVAGHHPPRLRPARADAGAGRRSCTRRWPGWRGSWIACAPRDAA